MTYRTELQAQIARLIPRAETGEQWAEICRLEALANNSPLHGQCDVCLACDVELSRVNVVGIETHACEECCS